MTDSRPRAAAADTALWTAVDRWFDSLLLPADPALAAALAANASAGLPAIDVAPNQGKLLHLLARMLGARRILEIGTLGAYSTIWLARALPPGGALVTLEANALHARVARANLERAGLAGVVELREGPALDSLAAMAGVREAPFDFAFVDADKPSNPAYFERLLGLVRPGGAIVFDNVVRRGTVLNADGTDENVVGSRRLQEAIAAEPRVDAVTIQTVGVKGHDGFTLVRIRDLEPVSR